MAERFRVFTERVGYLSPTRGKPASEEKNTSAGAWNQSLTVLLLLLVHNKDEIRGQGHGGRYLATSESLEVDAPFGQ